jgi:hypothetical protein
MAMTDSPMANATPSPAAFPETTAAPTTEATSKNVPRNSAANLRIDND